MNIICFGLGVTITFIFSVIALKGRDTYWKCEAYQHGAGVWTENVLTGKKNWQWMDDWKQNAGN